MTLKYVFLGTIIFILEIFFFAIDFLKIEQKINAGDRNNCIHYGPRLKRPS